MSILSSIATKGMISLATINILVILIPQQLEATNIVSNYDAAGHVIVCEDAKNGICYDCDTPLLKFIENKEHPMLGKASYIGGTTLYTQEMKKTYQSGYFPNNKGYTNYDKVHYNTYKFEKYFDAPIDVMHARKVSPDDSFSFTIETTYAREESLSTTVSNSYSTYYEAEIGWETKIGVSVGIKDILTQSSEGKYYGEVRVGGTVGKTITEVKESTVKYQTIYTETFLYQNKNDYPTYYQFNYRQKFNVYVTTAYTMEYRSETKSTGLLGKDKTYKHYLTRKEGIQSYFFMLPVDNPYFEVSQYYDSANGIKTIIDHSHPMIYYA